MTNLIHFRDLDKCIISKSKKLRNPRLKEFWIKNTHANFLLFTINSREETTCGPCVIAGKLKFPLEGHLGHKIRTSSGATSYWHQALQLTLQTLCSTNPCHSMRGYKALKICRWSLSFNVMGVGIMCLRFSW